MKRTLFSVTIMSAAAVAAMFGVASYRENSISTSAAEPTSAEIATGERKTMRPFGSDAELVEFLKKQRTDREERQTGMANSSATAAPAKPSADAAQESKAESITNNQTAGVDEGGIVKTYGDYLVILRRGRLFTVRVGDDSLRPVSMSNAFAPGVSPQGDWYDEMLISGDNVVVIGYSYARGGTELNLFKINSSGRLNYRSTYHLRSNDYYSSRNYASRLIGDRLVFYTPTYLNVSGREISGVPAIRRWSKNALPEDFRPVLDSRRIYRPNREMGDQTTLHTVTSCEIGTDGLDCKGSGVLGSAGRVFYVAEDSVYVWTGASFDDSQNAAMLYRMPLDVSAPTAIAAVGGPVDQFSFLEKEGRLNVFIRRRFTGDAMWNAETEHEGSAALLRLDVSLMGDGSETTPRSAYLKLDAPQYYLQNRFVGDHLIYGSGETWKRGSTGERENGGLYLVNWRTGKVSRIDTEHQISRIEPLGANAIVIGPSGKDLYFTPVELGDEPRLRTSFVRENAAQSETRSHGFFYRETAHGRGVLGLPIAGGGRAGYRQLRENASAMIFLRNDGLNLTPAGELTAETINTNDGCRASCTDWYGNSRPIFLGGRILALMGYEIVEGSISRGRIQERRRISFTPAAIASGRSENLSPQNDLDSIFNE